MCIQPFAYCVFVIIIVIVTKSQNVLPEGDVTVEDDEFSFLSSDDDDDDGALAPGSKACAKYVRELLQPKSASSTLF